MYIFKTIIASVFILSVDTATMSIDTMDFGQPNLKHHFYIFALSVATATVSVDTLEFGQPNKNHHFNMFALSVATATVSVDTISFCVYIYNFSFQCVCTKRCYCNR